MTECSRQYEEARKAGRRFIDQVRSDPPAASDFVSRRYLDVTYAEGSEKRKLDIYLPNEGTGLYPVIIDIFGGGWYFGKRSSYKMNLALELLKRGFAVVSIDYSLSKEAKFPTQIYEIKAAVRFIKNHAEDYLLDADRIAFLGESAGAHLGAVAATSVGAGAFEDIPFGESGDASVRCMVALYCPTDLGITKEQFEVLKLQTWVPESGGADSPEGILLGDKVSKIPEIVRSADPETYITVSSPAFLFFHGSDDRVVPYLQSMNFAVKLMQAIGTENVAHYLVDGAGHDQTHFMKERYYEIISDFLYGHMK